VATTNRDVAEKNAAVMSPPLFASDKLSIDKDRHSSRFSG